MQGREVGERLAGVGRGQDHRPGRQRGGRDLERVRALREAAIAGDHFHAERESCT